MYQLSYFPHRLQQGRPAIRVVSRRPATHVEACCQWNLERDEWEAEEAVQHAEPIQGPQQLPMRAVGCAGQRGEHHRDEQYGGVICEHCSQRAARWVTGPARSGAQPGGQRK